MSVFTTMQRRLTVSYTVTGLIAAACLLLLSLAGVTALTPTNGDFEAEVFTPLPAGAFVASETAASGGKYLAMEQNGTVTKTTTTPAVDKILVSARGSQCKAAPYMTVKVDGVQVIATSVNNISTYAAFTGSKSLAAGSHTVAISFSNDYWTGSRTCDRNLYLDSVAFVSSTTLDTSTSISTAADTTKPSVSILMPISNGTYSGTINAQAAATDNVAVTQVNFYLDGSATPLKSDTIAPYCVAGDIGTSCTGWDTTNLSDGTHILKALASDAAGNFAEATSSFTTKNAVAVKYPPDVKADAAASGGSVVFMYSNGRAFKQVTTPAVTALTVTAKGDQCQGAPVMIVKFDDVQVASIQVSSTTYTPYKVNVAGNAGVHNVELRFENDFYPGTCDRNLYLDKVEFTPVEVGDTIPPVAAVLTGTAGDGQVGLNWTAATDNVGVVRYEIWMNDSYHATLPVGTLNYTAGGLVNGTPYKFRVVAYDATGKYANSNSVTVTPTSTSAAAPAVGAGCPAGVSPASFPSRLKASGRYLVDENGCIMPKMKGFNIHAAPGVGDSWAWPNSDFVDIHNAGARVLRTVVHWSSYESQQGVINASNLTGLDNHIARAQRNGLYVILELHLNVGKVPSWATSGNDETEKYAIYGQNITQTLAKRYSVPRSADGITIDPRTVLGFSINEPPQDGTTINSNNSIPTLESQQRQMINWFRQGGSPGWIGFVTLAYANQKPYVASPKISADPHAYDSVGGNVVFDAHDYLVINDSTDPNNDSRQANGVLADTRFSTAHWLGILDPHNFPSDYTLATKAKSQMKAYLKPFDNYATAAQMPLMIGEFGWNGDATGATGKAGYYAAKREAMDSVNSAIQIHWIYSHSTAQDQWSAKTVDPNWDQDVLSWLKAP